MKHSDVSTQTEYAANTSYGRKSLGDSGLARVRVLDTAKVYVMDNGQTDEAGERIPNSRKPRKVLTGERLPYRVKALMLGERLDRVTGDPTGPILLEPRDIIGAWDDHATAEAARLEAARLSRENAAAVEGAQRALDARLLALDVAFIRHAGSSQRTLITAQATALADLLDTLKGA